jgi:hypothetical protein
MKAIVTKYLGPTDRRGSRIKAEAEGGNRVTLSYDHASDNPHRDAAVALCLKLNWHGTLAEGGLPDGRCVFVFCDHDADKVTIARTERSS